MLVCIQYINAGIYVCIQYILVKIIIFNVKNPINISAIIGVFPYVATNIA